MSTDDDKPPPQSPSSSASPSVSELRDALDSRFEALKGALKGIEYEQRTAREARATDARLSRSGHEVTQGSIRAHRGETDRTLTEIGIVRANVSEILALVRAAPRAAIAVTAPVGLSRWEAAGWRVPTPHQVLWLLMSLSIGVPLVGLAQPGGLFAKACELVAWLCGSKGIELARNFVSPQLRAKADAFDAHAIKQLEGEKS